MPLSFRCFTGYADAIFASVGSGLLDTGLLLLLKGLLSMALLLGPTILMGGTFPVLAAWLQKSDGGRGTPVSALLFRQQPRGGLRGGCGGFWLVEWLGLARDAWNIAPW